jgi:hypothetical protein
LQYGRGGLPKIKEIYIPGTFNVWFLKSEGVCDVNKSEKVIELRSLYFKFSTPTFNADRWK